MNLLQIHEPGETPLPHEDVAAVGIDLGTTNSVVAIASQSGVEVVHNIHGNTLVPSVVWYAPDGEIEVGYPAKKRHDGGEKGTIASVKRLMGRGVRDIATVLGNLPYDVVEGAEGMVRLKVWDKQVTPVEVSSDILKSLKASAEKALGKEVTQAVITVPAYFDDAARLATKDAARLAGIEVLRLINEPTAAALAYGLDKGVEGIYAIFDLGGGTFDMSLLRLEQGIFQVLATAGDTMLGGDDFDQVIAAWLLTETGHITSQLAPTEIAGLVALARKAKHELTDQPSSVIPFHGKQVTLERSVFNELIIPYVGRCIDVCEQALMDARLSISDVKGVVMVGGSTRVPLVKELVEEFFGKKPLCDVNPDEVVAIGAALQARNLSGGLTEGPDELLLDVIPLSLGLEIMGGITEKIIYRNTPIPVSVSQEFTTYQDGQTGLQVHVVQGEREMVADNRSLSRFELAGIPPLPAGVARVKVTFTVDADGLLMVAAEEKHTGVQQSVHVHPSYGLPPEQIEQMLLASMENAKADITQRLLVETRVEAHRLIAELQGVMQQDGQLLLPGEKERFERQMQVLANAAEGDDRDYIDVETQELGRLTQAFAERRMDSAIGLALKGVNVNEVGSG